MKIKSRLLTLLCAVAVSLAAFSSCGVIKGDTVMEYEGYKITETMYSYWLSKYKSLFLYSYNNGKDEESFWNSKTENGEQTYKDFVTSFVDDYAKQVLISMKLFDDYSLVFSQTVKDAVSDKIDGIKQAYGGVSYANEYLGSYGLNVKTLESIYYAQEKFNAVCEYLFGENGPYAVTDEEKSKYYEENYYCAEWIYIYTKEKPKLSENGEYITDSNGEYVTEKLSEEEIAEKQALVDEIVEKLNGGEDFLTLKQKHSEEDLTKYEYLPDGVNVSANDYTVYGSGFIKAIMNCKIGNYTVFEDDFATFIIRRNELKSYSELSVQEKNVMLNFDTYVYDYKCEKFFNEINVNVYSDVVSRYDISVIKALSNTNI